METKTIKTQSGREVVLRTFITARDMRILKALYLAVAKFDVKGGEVFDVDAKKAEEIENKTLELVVVSVDGDKEGIVEKLLEFPSSDYNEVFEAVGEVTGLDKKKENS